MKNQFLSKIKNRTAQVAIIGLGYVGLPLAVAFAEAGFPVVGIDVDLTKVDAINTGHSYISDIPSARLAPLVGESKRQKAKGKNSLWLRRTMRPCPNVTPPSSACPRP